VTRCTIRRPEPNAFQRLIAAVVAADEQRIEDAAVRVVRDRLKTKRRVCRPFPIVDLRGNAIPRKPLRGVLIDETRPLGITIGRRGLTFGASRPMLRGQIAAGDYESCRPPPSR
jgi:hypothetical protein